MEDRSPHQLLFVYLKVSWTQALRTIVKNCYKQHGREDLLYAFEDQQVPTTTTTQHHLTAAPSIAHLVPSQTVVQTINNPDGTVSLIQVSFSCIFEYLEHNYLMMAPFFFFF